jgi:hypothetical protein
MHKHGQDITCYRSLQKTGCGDFLLEAILYTATGEPSAVEERWSMVITCEFAVFILDHVTWPYAPCEAQDDDFLPTIS